MIESIFLFYGALGCISLALGVFTYVIGTPDIVEVSLSGERGYQRQKSREDSTFVFFEKFLIFLASWFSLMPLGGLRSQIDQFLREAGNYLGLSPDEFLAMSAYYFLGGFACCSVLFLQIGPMLMLGGLTALLPYVKINSIRDRRAVLITRNLPRSIELIVLCVSAGMDFPGALRELIGSQPENDDPLYQEYRQFLRDLDLGHSRKQALLGFGERAKGDGVEDFVAALIQSEEKGNPLKEVLIAQSKLLQMRRSSRAEELANQAAVKMVIPLALLMFMILILIVSPMFLSMQESGL